MKDVYLAADFGGSSGRIMAGWVDNGKIRLKEIYRFGNRQIRIGKFLYWDFPALFQDMKDGIARTVALGYNVRSIGIDTWGVDFGLIDKDGNLLGNPVSYRDNRTSGLPERYVTSENAVEHYMETGIAPMPINTLFQLLSVKESGFCALEMADRLLFMPDLFAFYLTGVSANEYSISSTSELLDARRRCWSTSLMERFEIPSRLFGEIVMPGTVLGSVKGDIVSELNLRADVKVVAVASHDTASAVYAAPVLDTESAFLSSGTWSLLGKVLDNPVLTDDARKNAFSNEGGADGKICFLQNITGLWIMQRLMAEWERKGESQTYAEVCAKAETSGLCSVIDVDDVCFHNPADMETAVVGYCRKTGQKEPVTHGDFVRCICCSLAHRYKKGIDRLNAIVPFPINSLNIIGGGSQNRLLNQMTADVSGLDIYAGPVEATAIGNIAMQIRAVEKLNDSQVNDMIRHSSDVQVYMPH